MSTVDASIPLAGLQANAQAWDPQRMVSLMEMGQQMRARQQQQQMFQQQQQQQNALRTIFANPASMGPDGQMRPEAVQQVMAIDPKAGMALREQSVGDQVKRATIDKDKAQMGLSLTEANLKKQAYIEDNVRAPAIVAYEKAIKAGIPPAQATQVAQVEFSKAIDAARASGIFSEEEQDKFPRAFDYTRSSTNSKVYKDYVAAEEKRKADERAEKSEAERERHDQATERAAAAREANSEARTERMLKATTDGKPPAGYRWAKDKPNELEPIPGGPATKSGSTVGGKMNPAMRASVELDMKEIQYGVDQIAKLKSDTASGFFADEHEGNAISRWIKRKVTPDQEQEYDTMANRFAMAIASIQSMGRGTVSDAKINEAKKLVPVPGDTKGNVEIKLKTIRRIVELAKESLNTPIKGGDRSESDDVQDAIDFSSTWK